MSLTERSVPIVFREDMESSGRPATGARVRPTVDSMIEYELPEGGAGPQLHVHPAFDEGVEVVEGRLWVHVAGRERELGAGESITLPGAQAHTFAAAGGRVRIRITSDPIDVGALIRRLAAVDGDPLAEARV